MQCKMQYHLMQDPIEKINKEDNQIRERNYEIAIKNIKEEDYNNWHLLKEQKDHILPLIDAINSVIVE